MTPSPEPEALQPLNRVSALRRPLVGLAFGFVAGTACGLAMDVPASWLLASAVPLLPLALFPFRRLISVPAISLLVVLGGWINASLSVSSPSGRELSALMARPREYVPVAGIVIDDPAFEPGRREGEVIRTFTFQVEGLRRTEAWDSARGRVAVWWKTFEGARAPRYGDRWILTGLLGRDAGEEGPIGTRPGCTLRADGSSGVFVSAGHGSPLIAWCLRARRACFDLLGRGLEDYPEQAGLLRALLLGYRQELSDAMYKAFSTTGTLHVIAISGLHVAVMAMLMIAFLQGMGVSRPYWILYLAPALTVYTIATGMSPSAVRACVMAIVFWSAPLFGRRPDGPSAIALAAILILAFAPEQLADRGFQFSFAAVAGLMVFYPPWMRPVQARLAADPWRVQREPFWVRWARAGALEASSIVVGSMAALLATIPLTAYYFNLVSPVALLANLVAIPLSSLVLLSGVLSLVIGSWWGFAAEVFNHASRVFISWMLTWVDWMAEIPRSYLFVKSPALEWVVFWYAALVFWMASRGLARKAVAAAVAAVLMVGIGTSARPGRVAVDILDVGQGNAALVNVPGGNDLLVDAGPRFMGRRVVQYLRRQGVDGLQALVLTHGDADHVGGALEVLRSFPVRELWCAPFVSQSRLCLEILDEAGARGVRVRRLTARDRGSLAGGVEWEVLHPSGDGFSRRADDVSLVVRIGRGATSVLFMGGAGEPVERAILDRPVDVSATVLVVGNHGAAGTCSREWLESAAPECAVISVGADNDEGHPDRCVLQRLAGRGIAVRRTDAEGAVRIVFAGPDGAVDGRGVDVAAATPSRPAR